MTEKDLPGMDGVRVLIENGHTIEITVAAVGPTRAYRLECIDCGNVSAAALLHEATTRPVELVAQHIVNRPVLWPEGLDWNNTGRWAVVSLLAGSSGREWAIYPSISTSRWESQEHATRYAEKRRGGGGFAAAAVIEWGDDLKQDNLFENARVRAAFEAQGVSFQG